MRALMVILLIAFLAETATAKPWSDDGHGRPHLMPPGHAKKLVASAPEPAAEPAAPESRTVDVASPEAQPVTETRPVTVEQGQPQPVAEPVQNEGDQAEAQPPILEPAPREDSAPEPGPIVHEPPVSEPYVAVPIAGDLEASVPLLGLGILVGASAVGLGIRVVRHTPAWWSSRTTTVKPPTAPLTLTQLLERADRNPFDGETRFRLGVQLLEHGRDREALRFLTQAIRYHPQSILRILREPGLVHVREHAGVREILRRFQRENSRRLWTAYS